MSMCHILSWCYLPEYCLFLLLDEVIFVFVTCVLKSYLGGHRQIGGELRIGKHDVHDNYASAGRITTELSGADGAKDNIL